MNLSDKKHDEQHEILLRLLFYGAPKTRKTWLAGTAAAAGFNTILLDMDHGYHILLDNLSEEAQKRLTLLECRDSLKAARASTFLTKFLKSGKVWFDEKEKKPILLPQQLNDNCIELDVDRHLTKNTVLILDSYTALCASLQFQYAKENNIDLSDAKKVEWDGYGWAGRLASWVFEKLSQLPCHVIVVGHKTIYEKYTGTGKDRKVDWVRQQIKSVSGPHSMTIGDKFSDILYFEAVSSIRTTIDTRPGKDREGGSRVIKPDSYDWNKLQFADICKMAHINLPSKDLPFLDFSINKELVEAAQQKANTQTIKPAATKAKLSGLNALLNKSGKQ